MTGPPFEKLKAVPGGDSAQPDPQQRQPEAKSQLLPSGRQWTSSLPQVASEDIIDIGNGRFACFRRDRRFAQVQVTFTAPPGIDPNPGRELTDQFKQLGWTWREKEPGNPWTYQLERSTKDDPTARGDSRDTLHEQFFLIIQEYRQKHGLAPISDCPSTAAGDAKHRNADSRCVTHEIVADQAAAISEKQKLPSAKREARAGGPALEMLDAFASVGAERFDLTVTDLAGSKVLFRGNRTLDQLRPVLDGILQKAAERQHNVIVRPRSAAATLIQLDDLGEEMAARLLPVSFLVLRTSPGSYQAWLAMTDADTDFTRRLRKGTGADLTASGATRISGSLNFKEKYAPEFPRVETVHICPGRMVTGPELQALGIVVSPERGAPAIARNSLRKPSARGWPNYQRCLEKAPPARDGHEHDASRADFTFCLLALDWGWGVEKTAARLMQESSKAQENGIFYALRTAKAAAVAIERRGELQP